MKKTISSLGVLPLIALALAGCDEEARSVDKAPPPISGGSMLITANGQHAVAADQDADAVFVVDLADKTLAFTIQLDPGDEPGRLVEDGDGRVHVALRNAGSVATIDPKSGKLVGRQAVCNAPRGLAYDAAQDALVVACQSGQLVTLRAGDRSELRRLSLDRDLRDVVVEDGGVTLTRFRSAEVLRLDTLGNVTRRAHFPQTQDEQLGPLFEPFVAWRMRPLPGGGAIVAHQRAFMSFIPLPPPGAAGNSGPVYYSSVPVRTEPGIVHTAVSVIRPIGDGAQDPPATPLVPLSGLPVDVAVSTDGAHVALAAAASGTVVSFPLASLDAVGVEALSVTRTPTRGQPIAVAFDASDRIWVQTRSPAAIELLGGEVILLGEERPTDGGNEAAHDLFHLTVGDNVSIACASCHPEGGDDGRVWFFRSFDGTISVARRTQTMRGGLTSGPYHWDGALADFDALVQDVMVVRMGGADPGSGRTAELADWLIDLPAFPKNPVRDRDAVARGQALFDKSDVGCEKCHNGAKLTNDETVAVGTGEALQVPTLIGIANRAPFMHDGCATTLRERFGPCGGGDEHGKTSHLSESELDDLIAYLETL